MNKNLRLIKSRLDSGEDPFEQCPERVCPLEFALARTAHQRPVDEEIAMMLLGSIKPQYHCKLSHILRSRLKSKVTSDSIKPIYMIMNFLQQQPRGFDELGYLLSDFLSQNCLSEVFTLIELGLSPMTLVNDDLQIQKCTNPLSLCRAEQPYLAFNKCANTILTYFMHIENYPTALKLVKKISANDACAEQLGYHLVVAARNNQEDLAWALWQCGASTNIRYPVGKYANCTFTDFVKIHNFDKKNAHREEPPRASALTQALWAG